MQQLRNYYAILGVSRDATAEEIKKSFRKLARQYHPDVNPGDKTAEEKFKSINEAYDILSDEAKRADYDRVRFGKTKRRRLVSTSSVSTLCSTSSVRARPGTRLAMATR